MGEGTRAGRAGLLKHWVLPISELVDRTESAESVRKLFCCKACDGHSMGLKLSTLAGVSALNFKLSVSCVTAWMRWMSNLRRPARQPASTSCQRCALTAGRSAAICSSLRAQMSAGVSLRVLAFGRPGVVRLWSVGASCLSCATWLQSRRGLCSRCATSQVRAMRQFRQLFPTLRLEVHCALPQTSVRAPVRAPCACLLQATSGWPSLPRHQPKISHGAF